MERKLSLYSKLGVERNATPDQIKRAYRKRAAKAHPDVAENKEAEFMALVLARDVLLDPEARAQYDETGAIPKRPNPTAAAMLIRKVAVVCATEKKAGNLLASIRENLSEQSKALSNGIKKCDESIAEVKKRWQDDEMKEHVLAEFEQQREGAAEQLKITKQAIDLLKDSRYDYIETPRTRTFSVGSFGNWTIPTKDRGDI